MTSQVSKVAHWVGGTRHAPASPQPAEGVASDELSMVKSHAADRCTFFAPTASGRVVVKAYAADPAPVVAVLTGLAQRGLASGVAPTAAPLVAWDPALRLVVTEWFDAPSAVELISGGAGRRAVSWPRPGWGAPPCYARRRPRASAARLRFATPAPGRASSRDSTPGWAPRPTRSSARWRSAAPPTGR
jgi:hypothetical protein